MYDAESQELLEELQGTSEVQSVVAFWDRDEQSLGSHWSFNLLESLCM